MCAFVTSGAHVRAQSYDICDYRRLGGLVVLFIGYIIGIVSQSDPLPDCCLKCLHTHGHDCFRFSPYCCDHFGIGALRSGNAHLRTDNEVLRRTNRTLNEAFDNLQLASKSVAYAKSIDEQEVVDLLIKATKPLAELKERLD